MTLVLRDQEVRELATFPGAIKILAEGVIGAYRDAGDRPSSERSTLQLPGGWLRIMSGSLPSEDILGFKAFHLRPGGVRYLCAIYRLSTGESLALLDANYLTLARTSATAAAAAAHYWGDEPIVVAVIGSGVQAREGLVALDSVCRVSEARVFSPRASSRARYAAELAGPLGIPVRPVASPAEATDGADMILCGTDSAGEVALPAASVGSARYVSSIGSTLPAQRELDGSLIASADRVIIDTLDAVHESGDMIDARARSLDESRLLILARFLSQAPDRATGHTVYKSIGSIEQDLALAASVWRQAQRSGTGETIDPIEATKSFHGMAL